MLSTKLVEIDDLLLEILLRLPSLSVDRFKSMCKQWHSLIMNPDFRKQWRIRNLKPATGLILCIGIYPHNDETRYIPFSSSKSETDPSPFPKHFKIKSSCNGLLLCESGFGYHVYNPTTRYRSLTLPKPSLTLENSYGEMNMSLAFDPNKSPCYTIVSCVFCAPDWFQIHVYSSSTRSWTLVLDQVPRMENLGEGVYWNGSIHWINALLYFNIEEKILKEMPEPPDDCDWSDDFLGESCGRLNYAMVCESESTLCIIVYELKKDYSQWVLKYNVSLQNFDCKLLSIVHGAEEDDSFLVLRKDREIVRQSLVSNTSEELYVLPPNKYWCSAFQYIESLL